MSASAPSQPPAQPGANTQAAPGQKLPAKGITAADLAKVKWLNGAYKGIGAPKPFFNKYAWNGTTLNIASYDDEAMTKENNKSSFVLKDGVFANPEGENDRFAASEITDDYIQFVTLTPGKTQAFRMERKGDGNVEAVLEWTGPDGNPTRQSYTLEPLKK